MSFYLTFILLFLLCYQNGADSYQDIIQKLIQEQNESLNPLRMWLTISAQKRYLEVSWINAPADETDLIIITKNDPKHFKDLHIQMNQKGGFFNEEGSGGDSINPTTNNQKQKSSSSTSIASSLFDNSKKFDFFDEDFYTGSGGYNDENSSSNVFQTINDRKVIKTEMRGTSNFWLTSDDLLDIVAALKPSASAQWFTTGIPFDFALTDNITHTTGCYGYWASYVNSTGDILGKTCLQAHATWMNDLRPRIGLLRFRDIFLVGSHDSGSYRRDFDPLFHETILTKYALTQDDDIRSQLLHGVRYLDIRIGYYRHTHEMFFINHGITRQIPLIDVINQVKDFVNDTNEIVIFGMKEFPFGFKRNISAHHLLVSFLREHFGDMIVDPSLSWRCTLNDIWSRKQNVILAYDSSEIVAEYPNVLFQSVAQRWGNVQKWSSLESYLRHVHSYDITRISPRPVADMAELTPDTWGVVLDKYGGLRRLADKINWRVSQLYREDLVNSANIVAADFVRGTSLLETSLAYNKRKLGY